MNRTAEQQLQRWKLVADFKERLEAVWSSATVDRTWTDSKRKLQVADYLSLFLFGLFNPAVRTMQGLCSASRLPRVQQEICSQPVSLGSFSEAQHLLDPVLLEKIFLQLQQEGQTKLPQTERRWLIQDSTLWHVLPQMHWALWRHQHKTQRAIRLHVSLQVFDQLPSKVTVTEGRKCERRVWKDKWKPGEAYIGDAYFGQDYGLLDELSQIGSSYVVRVREDVALQVEQELPLRPEDLQANVIGQAWVRLGSPSRYQSQRMRLVRVQTPKQVLLLVTNLNPEQLSAQLVAELYRRRWQVELFFRWIKCILGCRHWLAQSPEGVALQIYLALIGAALLQFYTERRPTRRMMELLWFYTVGMATADDLEAALKREKARLQPKMS